MKTVNSAMSEEQGVDFRTAVELAREFITKYPETTRPDFILAIKDNLNVTLLEAIDIVDAAGDPEFITTVAQTHPCI